MRRGPSRTGRATLRALAWLCLLGPPASRAVAQIPQPEVPDTEKRSGLFTHFGWMQYRQPPDWRRDTLYDNTRFVDNPQPHFPNNNCNGGMYGFKWRGDDTASVYPYFYGSPGQSTITPYSRWWRRPHRFVQAMTHQGNFHPPKPVGMYYHDGSYVPIYDLDPVVPGPGPYPIPWFLREPKGG